MKYNYYLHEDLQFNPQESKENTYKNPKKSKFSISTRFKEMKTNDVPGPVYEING